MNFKNAPLLGCLLLLAACHDHSSSSSTTPGSTHKGATSAELAAALDQVAPYVLDHRLRTRTGAGVVVGSGKGASAHAPGGGILLSTGLASSAGLGSHDFGHDGLADSTSFRILLAVPPTARTLVMSAQFVTSEVSAGSPRANDAARVEFGTPGSNPAVHPIADAATSFETTSVWASHALDVAGLSTVEVRWIVADAADGTGDSALLLADVHFSEQADPGPIPPNDEFRVGNEVDSDNYFADPINLDTGAFIHDELLLSVASASIPFVFSLHYDSSMPPEDRPVGARWRHSYQWSLAEVDGGERVRVQRGDGGSDYFVQDGKGGYRPESEGTYTFLEKTETGDWTYTTKSRITYAFDSAGYPTDISDRNGNMVSLYHSDGILSSFRDTRGQVAHLTYAAGRVSSIDYGGLLEASLAFDGEDLVLITRPDGSTRTFEYDDVHRIELVRDAAGQVVVVNDYDDHGRVDLQYDGQEHASTVLYDGDTAVTTDREGAVEHKTFDNSAGRIERWENAEGSVWVFQYDEAHELVSELDPFERTTEFEYDERGNMISRLDVQGNRSRVRYDEFDTITSGEDPLGHVSQFEYDARGNLVARIDPLGHTDRYAYDAAGQLVGWVDAGGNPTSYEYTAQGDVSRIVDPLGQAQNFTYDALGRKLTETDENGHTIRFGYDDMGRLLQAIDPAGHTTSYEYDAQGRIACEVAADGAVTEFVYWPRGRLKHRIDPLGNMLSYEYGPEERLERLTDALGQDTQLFYDAGGRLERVVDAAGGTVLSEYDIVGRRTRVQDANGSAATFAYDALGQLVGQTDALGRTVTREHDAAGRLVARTNGRGQRMEFAYDAADQLVRAYLPSGDVLHAYDAGGNIVASARLGEARIHREYDALNRLVSRTDACGSTLEYEYDPAGNLITLTYPDGDRVRYTYDALDRLVRVVDWSGRSTEYAYGVAGDLTLVRLPDGAEVRYSYDAAGRLTGIDDRAASGETLFRTDFTLDAVGNVVQESSTLPLVATPELGELSLEYGPGNQLTRAGEARYAYDADGNMEHGVVNGVARSFVHDELGRLVQVGDDHYAYDVDGHRVEAEVGGEQRRYVVDTSVHPARVLEERDAQGQLVARYVHGLGLVGRDGAEGYRNYHFDSRGSTLALTDSSGAITDRYAYEPFGRLLASEGQTQNPFKYVGREGVIDDGNGLYFMRARYYAPELMRFLERDRAFLGALTNSQSLNEYAYVENNPITRVDPEGEFWNAVVGAVVGAVVNVAVQATIDIVNGEFSGWDEYAGAAVEGAVSGAFIGSGAGLAGFLIGAGGAGLGAFAGEVTQQLVGGEDLDLSSGELWKDVGVSAALGGAGHLAGKGVKHFKKVKAKKLQEAGNAKGLGKLLGQEAVGGYKNLYSPLKRGNLGRLLRSPGVRKSVYGELVLGYALGLLGSHNQVDALKFN